MAKTRSYLYYDTAVSICSTCYRRVDAKIVFEDGKVWMLKRCPQHGHERVLVADDVDYYRRCREVFIKTPEMPHGSTTPRSSTAAPTIAACARTTSSTAASPSSRSATPAT